ncbi:MAG: cytochrome b/b6 domain-containing protein [Aliishimia sp.]
MSAANSIHAYGNVAKSLHWLTALLILTLIPLGMYANGLPYDTSEELTRKAWLFSMHKTLGLTLFFVAVVRILWALRQVKPAPLHPERKLEHWLAETVHWLLYGSLLLVPLSGWVHHAATTGFAPIWWPFGQSLPFVPKSDTVASVFAGLHVVFERVLVVSLLLHIAGALKHHVVDKDNTLRRMLFTPLSASNAPTSGPHRASLPVVTAVTIWAVAVGLGGMIGVYDSHAAQTPEVTLEEVATDWLVTEGAVTIEVTQFGGQVQGNFADWTAAITFDPDVAQGLAGDVTATMSIPSLKLGSVTDQAMGPDFFDVETHPTAVFTAEIVTVPDGYEARGALSLKGQSVPLTFPLDLTILGNDAELEARVSLNRLDFGIGANMPDESSLAFGVDVFVKLKASRPQD